MEFNFAKKFITGISLRKLILMLVIILGGSALIYTVAPDLENLYFKEATFSTKEELEDLYSQRKYFVKYEVDSYYNTYNVCTEGNKELYYFFLFMAEDCYVMTRTSTKNTEEYYDNYTLSGMLIEPDDIDDQAKTQTIIDFFGSSYDETLNGEFSYYFIDETESRLFYQVVVGAGIAVILFALVHLVLAFMSLANYENNKLFRKLADGDNGDPDAINDALSKEYAAGNFFLSQSDMIITDNFIIHKSALKFTVYKKENLIWAYKITTQHRTNGIPTGKTHAVTMFFSDNKNTAFRCKKENIADEMVMKLKEYNPNMVIGFNNELETLYKNDTANFVELATKGEQPDSDSNTI